MNEDMIEIDKNEYKSILELAYKAAMLKEAVLNTAVLDYCSKGLFFGSNTEVATIFKYAFPDDYDGKFRELLAEREKEDDDNER